MVNPRIGTFHSSSKNLAHFSNDQRFVYYVHVMISVMQFDFAASRFGNSLTPPVTGLRCAKKNYNSTPFVRGTEANAIEWSYSFAADV